MMDPAAGLTFAAITEAIFLLDAYALPAAHIHRSLMSIYHLANLMVYPLSYFLAGNIHGNCEAVYAQWKDQYQTCTAVHRDIKKIMTQEAFPAGPMVAPMVVNVPVDQTEIHITHNQPIPATLAAQQTFLRENMPDVFNLLSVGFYIGRYSQAPDVKDASGYDKAKALLSDVGGKVYQWYEGKDIQFYDDEANATATLLLTALLTPQASPVPAMGYDFAVSSAPVPKSMESKTHRISQGALLPDHSGMMIPNKELFEKIYKKTLMHPETNPEQGFQKFGQYKVG